MVRLLLLVLVFVALVNTCCKQDSNADWVPSATGELFREVELVSHAFEVTAYYSPVPNQSWYFQGNYWSDKIMNCFDDCMVTSSGLLLTEHHTMKVVACPFEYRSGETLHIIGVGDVICYDRGGAITGQKLDIWTGIGEDGAVRAANWGRKRGMTVYRVRYATE